MNTRKHAIVLFNIDRILVDDQKSTPEQITWTGGSVAFWKKLIITLKKTARAHQIELHAGLVTSKGIEGDFLSAAVSDQSKTVLKSVIDPDLIFFTYGKDKVEYALDVAKDFIETKHNTEIKKKHVFIFEDKKLDCQYAELYGYVPLHINKLEKYPPAEQQHKIIKRFKVVYSKLNLPFPSQENSKERREKQSVDALLLRYKNTLRFPSQYYTSVSEPEKTDSNWVSRLEM
jgi:hypothetical protein